LKNGRTDKFTSIVHFMNKTQQTDTDEIELLVSKEVEATSGIPCLSRRMKAYMWLLLFGVLGVAACAFAMLNTGVSAEKIQEIGLDRVANSLENVLSIMAYPVLLFLILFVAFVCQQIYKEYRSVFNPKIYGRSRKR
jgi:hypothetical protein